MTPALRLKNLEEVDLPPLQGKVDSLRWQGRLHQDSEILGKLVHLHVRRLALARLAFAFFFVALFLDFFFFFFFICSLLFAQHIEYSALATIPAAKTAPPTYNGSMVLFLIICTYRIDVSSIYLSIYLYRIYSYKRGLSAHL